ISIISIMLSPSLESSLLFLSLLGWYPVIKQPIEEKIKQPFAMILKYLLVNVIILSLYYILLNVLKLPSLEEDLSGGRWVTVSLIVLYNFTFYFYDKLLSMIDLYYRNVLRNKLVR
ncbi:MAG: hypothetical protein IJ091_08795, partial [Oscillospiraceae bacterium]|nr:hypothetical protein [Oscillospiraceae bacterium]